MSAILVESIEALQDKGSDVQTDDRTSLIAQLQSENEYLKEQVSHLTQLLAVSQKSIQQLTEQNQLLLADQRSRPWWKRIFSRKLSASQL